MKFYPLPDMLHFHTLFIYYQPINNNDKTKLYLNYKQKSNKPSSSCNVIDLLFHLNYRQHFIVATEDSIATFDHNRTH